MDGLGEFLKGERLNEKVTIKEISIRTNIPEKIIDALEQNDYSRIPGKFYLKNFIKNYLQSMGLDYKDFLLKHYNLINNIPFTTDTEAAYIHKMKYSKFQKKGFFVRSFFLILLILGGYLGIYQNLDRIKIFLTPEEITQLKEIPQTKLHLGTLPNLINYGFDRINKNDSSLLENQFKFSKDKWAIDLVIIVNKKNWITIFQNGQKIIGRDFNAGEVLKLRGYNFFFHTQFASAIDILVNGKGVNYFKDKTGYQKLSINPHNPEF